MVVTCTAETSQVYTAAERRSKLRLGGLFPCIVRGVDAGGEAFEVQTVLDNISADGLHLRLGRHMQRGMAIFVVTVLKRSTAREVCAPRVALRCLVLRSERRGDGLFGVAAAILQNRFLAP